MKSGSPSELYLTALKLLEEGKTPQDIFAAFPEERRELESFFGIIETIRSAAGEVTPNKASFEEVLISLNRPVAEEKGFSTAFTPSFRNVLVPAGAIALFIGMFFLNARVNAPVPSPSAAFSLGRGMVESEDGGDPLDVARMDRELAEIALFTAEVSEAFGGNGGEDSEGVRFLP